MHTISRRLVQKISVPIFRTSTHATKLISTQNQHRYEDKDPETKLFGKLLIGAASAGLLATYFDEKKKVDCKVAQTSGTFKDGLPEYTIEEVSKHNTQESRIWVTYKEGVYDITDFVPGHPGGDQILMAAGSSVEPFWVLYGIHENQHVYDILEKYRIGNLDKHDAQTFTQNMEDPYSSDPKRHPVLKPASVKPFNAEPPPSLLVENFITPKELFYVRNHLPVPNIDAEQYKLEIEIEGAKKTVSLSLDDLKKMPKKTITATIMCAGNRRSEMVKVKTVKGLNWGPAAVANATWTGVPLRDVLKNAGLDQFDDKYKHVQFEAEDVDATGKNYGASIPIWKAIDERGDVLLAYEMNGAPLPRDHGYPVRVIVPGVVGARNVKWLAKIVISEHESTSHWQQNDYKGFSPCTDWEDADFTKSPAIQELPVTSAICKPYDGDTIDVVDGKILIKGYAWSGGGQKIVRVDVSADGGKTWHVANVDAQDSSEPPRHWSWTLWSANIPVDNKSKTVGFADIMVKAVDSCYNTQPENFEHIWNIRGVLGNAYHKIKVNLKQ
ncbi:unnamed protein product [Acanthoscelides obtectus]|uniref:Sulfite oxidase n=1 Tax=Acanthoscelides obtectus TaxID=200917 RepID=A0A9P0LVH0_ACAOB|nr:unnamed protein product [Acanthoscelides obtectus]CAK1630305.1 Probable sulfite oxidase, mitochondrial [Acanthoscelides obtectus]